MDFPNVKLSSSISGFFLTIHTGLFFMSVAVSLGIFQSTNALINPIAVLRISVVGMIIGAIMHYIVSTYLEWKDSQGDESATDAYKICWIFALIVYYFIAFVF